MPRGTPVLIQQKMESGGRGWQREGVTQVRREGTFRYSESVTRGNRSYRACLQVRGGQICSKSQLVRVIKPRSYTLSAQVVTETVEFGQNVTVEGAVSPRAVGDRVKLVASPDSWKTKSVVATTRVKKSGSYSVAAAVGAAGRWQYRVLKPKTLVGFPAESGVVKVTVTKRVPTITVTSVTPTVLEAGQSVTVTGTAGPLMSGLQVQLEISGSAGSWAPAGTATIDPAGNYSLTVPINQSGAALPVRVTAPETASTAAASASAGTVKVYGWISVRDLVLVSQERGSSSCTGGCTGFGWRTLNIGPNTYSPGYEMELSSAGPSTSTWNVEYKCTRFRSDYGLASTSATGAISQFALLKDAVRVPLGVLALGQVGTADVDITGAYRLTFETSKSGSTAAGDSAWGNPQVLCAF